MGSVLKYFVFRTALLPGCLAFVSGQSQDEYIEPQLDDRDRSHWAYQPIEKPSVPDVGVSLDNPIDAFVLRKLQEVGLDDFAARADQGTLNRRFAFQLTGLPPTLEEIAGTDSRAFVDELLSRPQYGERWAQHWLDVTRFAETDGYEHDKVRGEAWRYRDWVIDALNRDVPYDRFISLQVAGDELAPNDDREKAATGFLYCGPDMPDVNSQDERRHNVLNETTGSVGSAFLGVSMSCAQCHDHKYDPVSIADFYRLRAFFDNAVLPPKNKSLPHHFTEKGELPSFVRIRGDYRRSGPELKPAFLRIVSNKRPDIQPKQSSSGRRAALAGWLSDPANPLVARVAVNRVWQHHFGRGLVATPNDFGKMGERPTHPELLDWLATDFIEHGWSLKHLHQRILSSKTWQQTSHDVSSDPNWEKRLAIDPDGKLLSRRMRIRLSGEAIRDAMLQITGQLNLKPGGPGFRPPLPDEVTVTLLKNQWPVTPDVKEHTRRSVYLFARRNLRYPLFDVFDRPDGNLSCARRHVSTTAPQSLMLLNSEFSNQCAKALAARMDSRVFELVLGRSATPEESGMADEFIAQEGREAFALAMFNLNEFVFLD